ncbi:PEP-CTERM sorting domain-containing protein [Cerasicoccus fimbriatus]|uniref:PEP-CTERM sorting domain-containing protein n=1 Tax=Cerasicoccus fimbriatus TaxID=3014554 RepID=UPI0022B51A76|nr:PEP-CTERM sorting domain-containing protein [Cerasicoccus sp. TK19100]
MVNTRKILLSTLVLAPALLSAQTVLVDFGDEIYQTTGQPETWNNAHLGIVPGGQTGELFADMLDTTNNGTGITLTITNAFGGRNAGGTQDASAPYPVSAVRDSFYTATASAGVTPGDGLGVLVFSGLDISKTYDFTMFASRGASSASDNRETEYAFVGGNNATVYLDAADNVTSTVTAFGISPNASGEITLTVQKGPNNTSDYSYLGSLQMTVIPEPSSMALLVGAMATGFVMWRRRR